MNFKTTVVLLALLIVLGGYFFFVLRPGDLARPNVPAMPTMAGTALFSGDEWPADAVVRMVIQRDGGEVIFSREGQEWLQKAPVVFALDQGVENIARQVQALRYTEKFVPGEKGMPTIEQMGLAPAGAVLELQWGGEQDHTRKIMLGQTSLGNHGYLQVDGRPEVYVVNDDLHALVLNQNVKDWRKRALPAIEESQVAQVALEHGQAKVEMARTDADWSLQGGQSGRADREAIRQLLSDIGSVGITRFVADDPGDVVLYGLDRPGTVVRVVMAGAGPATSANQAASQPAARVLRIGSPVDLSATPKGYYATWNDERHSGRVVFEISKAQAERFNKPADAFRDARLTPIKSEDVRAITLLREEPVALERQGRGWAFAAESQIAKPTFPIDDAWATLLLESIFRARAVAYKPDAKPTGEAQATINLEVIGRPEKETLRVYAGPLPGEQWLVLRNAETTGYVLPGKELERIFQPTLALRQRTVLEIPRQRLAGITIRHADGREYVFTRELAATQGTATAPGAVEAPWTFHGSDRFEAAALDQLIGRLLPLRANGWIAAGSGAATQPHGWNLSVSLTSVEGLKHELEVDDLSTPAVARMEGLPWFELEPSLVDALGSEFRDRTLIRAAGREIAKVELKRGDETIVLTRDSGGDWVAGDGREVNRTTTGALVDTLAGLRVKRYLAHAPQVMPNLALTMRVTLQNGNTLDLSLPMPVKQGAAVGTTGAPLPTMALPGGIGGIGKMGDEWFLLDEATLTKLAADPAASGTAGDAAWHEED